MDSSSDRFNSVRSDWIPVVIGLIQSGPMDSSSDRFKSVRSDGLQ